MNEKQISQICLVIIIVGIILFVITYENEFCEKTISELITNEGNKGIIFGRVQRVIKNDGMALFVITDGKFLKITKNDFLVVYATSQTYNGKIELVAHRIEKR